MKKISNRAGYMLWAVEAHRQIHNAFVVKFLKPVKYQSLNIAVKKTIRTYPILKSRLVANNFSADITPNHRPFPVFKSQHRIAPLSKKANFYPFTISYHQRTLNIVMSHLLMDGNSFCEIFKTLIYYYLSSLNHRFYTSMNIRLYDKKKHINDTLDYMNQGYYPETNIDTSIHRQVFTVKYPKQTPQYAQLVVPYRSFMDFVNHYKTNRSIALCYLTLEAIDKIYRTNRLDYCATINVDVRRNLKIMGSLLNAVLEINLFLEKNEIEKKSIETNLKKLNKAFHYELSDEVVFHRINRIIRRQFKDLDIFPTIMLNYMGDLSLNQFAQDITDIDFIESSPAKLNVFLYQNNLYLDLVFYEWSRQIMESMIKTLKKYNIKVLTKHIKKMSNETNHADYRAFFLENKKNKKLFENIDIF